MNKTTNKLSTLS